MANTNVIINFLNGENLKLDYSSIIFRYGIIEHDNKKTCTKLEPFALKNHIENDGNFLNTLMDKLAKSEFFTVNIEELQKTKIYKTSAIFSIEFLD